jgi:hypothetical protein
MPLITQTMMGGSTTAASMLNTQVIVTIAAGVTFQSDWVEVNQLPNLRLYALQTAGATPANVIVQMAVRNDSGGGVLNPLSLDAPTIMPALNIPLVLAYSFPAAFMRVTAQSTAAGTVMTLVYGAYGP